MFPDWIALNNGTTHGIEATGAGIQVDLTAEIHHALKPYGTSGAQHGTSGNHNDKLKAIAEKTRTTKANVATALQMVGWGIKVNEYGNAIMENGEFAKVDNPPVASTLYYYLKADAKSAKLVIKDCAGAVVQELNGSAKKGLQKASWNLMRRMDAQQQAARPGGAAFRGRGANLVDYGDYKVTLMVDDKEVATKTVKVSPDPLFK